MPFIKFILMSLVFLTPIQASQDSFYHYFDLPKDTKRLINSFLDVKALSAFDQAIVDRQKRLSWIDLLRNDHKQKPLFDKITLSHDFSSFFSWCKNRHVKNPMKILHLDYVDTTTTNSYKEIFNFIYIDSMMILGSKITDDFLKRFMYLEFIQKIELNFCRIINPVNFCCLSNCLYLTHLSIANSNIRDEDFPNLENFILLEKLILESCLNLSHKSLQKISGCKNLKSLSLNMMSIDSSIFLNLSPLIELHYLQINNCQKIKSDDFLNFPLMEKLTHLDLSSTKIDHRGLPHILQNKQLKSLYLRHCSKITSRGFGHFSSLESLDVLDLSHTKINEHHPIFSSPSPLHMTVQHLSLRSCPHIPTEIFQQLSLFTRLLKLDASWTKIDDQGLKIVSEIQTIEELALRFCTHISTQGFLFIENLYHLQQLDLSGTSIDDQTLLQIQKLKKLKKTFLKGCQYLKSNSLKPEKNHKYSRRAS